MAKKSKYEVILNPEKTFVKIITSDLGNSQSSIRKSLQKMGIKGNQKYGDSCPLANYLHQQGFENICVDGDVDLSDGSGDLVYHLPKAFHSFVEAFDQGKFPELVEG